LIPKSRASKNIFTKQMARGEAPRAIFVARSASHFDCLFPAKRRLLAVCGRVQGSASAIVFISPRFASIRAPAFARPRVRAR
jgi:hypothetical protein